MSTNGRAVSAAFWRILGMLERVKKTSNGYEASCPGPRHKHEDRKPSLDLSTGYDGRVLLHCKAGCDIDEVLTAIGLTRVDLFEKSQAGNPVRRFRLVAPNGHVVAEHVREDLPTNDKLIRWERDGRNGLGGIKTEDLPLYRLPDLLASEKHVPVIVCEGEKAAQALADAGVLAVATVTGASGTPSEKVLQPLQGREVWLWPDNDQPGHEHMTRIAQKIKPTPKWIKWESAPEKGDAADFIGSGGLSTEIEGMVREPTVTLVSPKIWRASELMAMRFEPVQWAIPGLVPVGLSILAGRPKLGKSWLGLGWSLDVAAGAKTLGNKMKTNQGDVLYMALEDGPQRMQERLAMMLAERHAPTDLHIVTEWSRMNEGGLEDLELWLEQHPRARMVIIDTFKRVRPLEKNTQRLYDMDYDAIQPVAALARARSVAIMVVFHTRKGDSVDPVEMVSGTLGLSGAADAIHVLRRERGQADASLFVTGRDVEEQDLALRWEKENDFGWSLLGNADDFRRSKERQELLDAVASMPGMTPSEIADSLGKSRGSVRYLLFSMTRDGDLRTRDGKYYPRTNANSPNTLLPSSPESTNPPNTPTNTNRTVSAVRGDSAVGAVSNVREKVVITCRRCGRPRDTHNNDDPVRCRWLADEGLPA